MLLGIDRVAGLGAGVDGVEDGRLLLGIVAGLIVVFIPLRVFDDEIDLRVYFLGQRNGGSRDLQLLCQTHLLPGAGTFLLHARTAATVGKVKVI